MSACDDAASVPSVRGMPIVEDKGDEDGLVRVRDFALAWRAYRARHNEARPAGLHPAALGRLAAISDDFTWPVLPPHDFDDAYDPALNTRRAAALSSRGQRWRWTCR